MIAKFHRTAASKRPTRPSEGLITWDIIQAKMPWQLIFLLGSGFAISKGSNVSGLAVRLGQALLPLKELPPVLMLTLVLVFVSTMTEFTSNVGTANILLPIVAHMVRRIRVNTSTTCSVNTLTATKSGMSPAGPKLTACRAKRRAIICTMTLL